MGKPNGLPLLIWETETVGVNCGALPPRSPSRRLDRASCCLKGRENEASEIWPAPLLRTKVVNLFAQLFKNYFLNLYMEKWSDFADRKTALSTVTLDGPYRSCTVGPLAMAAAIHFRLHFLNTGCSIQSSLEISGHLHVSACNMFPTNTLRHFGWDEWTWRGRLRSKCDVSGPFRNVIVFWNKDFFKKLGQIGEMRFIFWQQESKKVKKAPLC